MDLMNLFQSVTQAIGRHNDPNQPQYPQSGLMGVVENLFQQHAQSTNQTLPASQDPYGDPGGNVQPASQDPYGDPGAYNARPASQDPYGDPG
jgi:hypothetical protein